jgi:hypothetical protein
VKLLVKLAVAAVVLVGGGALIQANQGEPHYTDEIGGGVGVLPARAADEAGPPPAMAPAPTITVPDGPPAPTPEIRTVPTPPRSSTSAPGGVRVPASRAPAGGPQSGALPYAPGTGSAATQPLPGDPGFPEAGIPFLSGVPAYDGCVTATGAPTLCPGQLPLPAPFPPRTLPLPLPLPLPTVPVVGGPTPTV